LRPEQSQKAQNIMMIVGGPDSRYYVHRQSPFPFVNRSWIFEWIENGKNFKDGNAIGVCCVMIDHRPPLRAIERARAVRCLLIIIIRPQSSGIATADEHLLRRSRGYFYHPTFYFRYVLQNAAKAQISIELEIIVAGPF
jgi:hypothetical protein